MSTEIPMLWHCAVSLVHRKVAIVSFLQVARSAQFQVFYHAHDAMALVIIEVAALVGVAVTAWDTYNRPTSTRPWVWIQSHEESHSHLDCPIPPKAVLCLGTCFSGENPAIPKDHRPFITGMDWSAPSNRVWFPEGP